MSTPPSQQATAKTEPVIKFTLHLTIEGQSLDDIDYGLSKAATERIMARKPHLKDDNSRRYESPSVGMVLKTNTEIHPAPKTEVNEVIEKAANEAVDEAIKKTKATAAKKTKKEMPAEVSEALTKVETRTEAVKPTEKIAAEVTKDHAVNALSSVNEKHGIDAARTILAGFNVKRLAELDPSKYSEFISKCEQATK